MSLEHIAANVARIREQIRQAAQRSGRQAEDVRLIAVTKYVGLDEVAAVVEAGCRDLGESRPQDLWSRAEHFSEQEIRWHVIGHLQRNKIRRTLPLATLLHSIDSEKLLAAIDRIAAEISPDFFLDGLLEINTSGDEGKHGVAPRDAAPLVSKLGSYPRVRIRGLMCMASLEGGSDQARRDFAALRSLRDELVGEAPDGVSLDELSMGMSGDFEVAIEEGATIVRIGSSLFERPE